MGPGRRPRVLFSRAPRCESNLIGLGCRPIEASCTRASPSSITAALLLLVRSIAITLLRRAIGALAHEKKVSQVVFWDRIVSGTYFCTQPVRRPSEGRFWAFIRDNSRIGPSLVIYGRLACRARSTAFACAKLHELGGACELCCRRRLRCFWSSSIEIRN